MTKDLILLSAKHLALLSVFWFITVAVSQKLGRYNISPGSITTSGISSGAAMAIQFHFAHSNQVKGVGAIAGVPFGCGYLGATAGESCMFFPNLVSINWLITQAINLERSGLIDPLSSIRGHEVFIFHGTEDTVVPPANSLNVVEMYQELGANIETEFSISAQHGWPTDNYGAPCNELGIAYGFLNNCKYNGAFKILNYLYGGRLTFPDNNAGNVTNLLRFDQADFFTWLPSMSSMSRTGFVYVPTECQNMVPCRLHISFHGCSQSSHNVGDTFVTRAGIIEVAEINKIIVLFPQIEPILANPLGCWDWFGYLNNLFHTKQGNQVLATYRMMNRIVNG